MRQPARGDGQAQRPAQFEKLGRVHVEISDGRDAHCRGKDQKGVNRALIPAQAISPQADAEKCQSHKIGDAEHDH